MIQRLQLLTKDIKKIFSLWTDVVVKQLNPVSFTWKNDANVYHPTEVESYEMSYWMMMVTRQELLKLSQVKMLKKDITSQQELKLISCTRIQSTLSGKSWVDSITNSRPQYDDDGNKLSEDESFYGIA